MRARLKFASQARRDYGALDFKISQRNLNFASKAKILNPRGLFCGVLLAVLGIWAQILRAAPQNFKAEAACDKIPPPARLPLKTLALKPCDAQDARSVSQIDARVPRLGVRLAFILFAVLLNFDASTAPIEHMRARYPSNSTSIRHAYGALNGLLRG